MHLKAVIFVLSFLSTSAYPLHRDIAGSREAVWANPDANHANAKTELSKDVKTAYKTHVDSGDLYTRLDVHNPMVEEMRRKLNTESERLRARLRQELAELRERLSPTPAASSSSGSGSAQLALRARLRPLARQLQSTMSGDTQELCGQLNLYLQGLEVRAEAPEVLEAVRWMGQTMEDSGSRLADVIGDFHAKASGVIDQFRGAGGSGEAAAIEPRLLQEMEDRWGQEVASLKLEVRSRAAAVKAELAALLVTASSGVAEVTATVERFCQSAALQNQVFQARIERLPQGLEATGEQGPQQSRLESLSLTSSSVQAGGMLQEDFSAKLSALIQDILTSVHSERDT